LIISGLNSSTISNSIFDIDTGEMKSYFSSEIALEATVVTFPRTAFNLAEMP
jgi:hypothetical protein